MPQKQPKYEKNLLRPSSTRSDRPCIYQIRKSLSSTLRSDRPLATSPRQGPRTKSSREAFKRRKSICRISAGFPALPCFELNLILPHVLRIGLRVLGNLREYHTSLSLSPQKLQVKRRLSVSKSDIASSPPARSCVFRKSSSSGGQSRRM